MSRKINWLLGALSFAIVLAAAVSLPAFAQSGDAPPTDDEVNAIAKELYCPVCENTPLDVCPTVACAQWRDLIREKLAAGWSQTEISQYFADQYGDRVLSVPPRTGLNWLIFVLPPLFLLVGVYLVYRNLKQLRNQSMADPSKTIEEDDPYVQEMEAALELLNQKDQEA